MRVEDCVGDGLATACRRLAASVGEDYAPDVLVGIERGGAEVVAELRRLDLFDSRFCAVSTARADTATKRRSAPVLRAAPRPVLNALRVAEHRVRVRRFRPERLAHREVRATADADATIRSARRVLVVDDAVDTGATLRAVLNHIRALTDAEVRSAALTVTFPDPVVDPRYAVHRGVLLRFPWSSDAVTAG